MTSTTMTVRLPTEAKDKLERLAGHTNRSLSFLAAQAIADYAERELSVVEGIDRALADAAAGRVVPHDEAMRRIKATIDRTGQTR
ncbi:ribbon-helix-helix protein, CopG family [Chelativorans sp. ZYF759]|uniref:CopG family ribbon-helix-helix protein n=1 Tax=Chelativorans sp. ZYF759 TaxID=2692213 RepID=UPI00145F45CC|nr:CopG family ribbon-helix-helix protein [Chelativorans sp. ZYF759]NMG39218.1 ribbon-helix-helix protein, CopG family [Chelativorans sp. ZYF759]